MSKYSENTPPDIQGAVGWTLDYIKPNTSFLDFGCSTGYFGSFIKKAKKINVDGVEISDDRIEAAKYLDNVSSFDIDRPWPKDFTKKYDYIFFGDVLEHLTNPTNALKQCRSILKDDGMIFVSIPNIAHMSIRLELLKGDFIYESMGILDNTHLQYFTLKTFTAAAKNAGFDAELVDYTVNDIPKDITQKYLDSLGLTATDAFWKITEELESRAYQYKFVLRQGKAKAKAKASRGKAKLEKPLQFRDEIISDYESQLAGVKKHSDEQAKIIDHYIERSERFEARVKYLEDQIVIKKPSLKKLKNLTKNGNSKRK